MPKHGVKIIIVIIIEAKIILLNWFSMLRCCFLE